MQFQGCSSQGPSPVTRDSCDCNQPLRPTDANGNHYDDDDDDDDEVS